MLNAPYYVDDDDAVSMGGGRPGLVTVAHGFCVRAALNLKINDDNDDSCGATGLTSISWPTQCIVLVNNGKRLIN